MPPSNLLFLMSDEHNARMLGCSGHPVVQTPNLDALAARGARFTSAYCNSPICVPSRASFATGRYPHQIGAWDNASPYVGQAPSWAHRLRAAGHPVTTIGKLHYRSPLDDTGFADQRIPMHVMEGRGDVFGCIRTDIPPTRFQLEHVDEAGPGESEYIRYDTGIADAAVRWLHEEAPAHERPWCLFVSFSLPHFPLIAPREYLDLYPIDEVPLPIQWQPGDWPRHPYVSAFREARVQSDAEFRGAAMVRRAVAAYFGMCTFVDAQIGRVLDALQSTGSASRTRVVYTSDHGETLGDYGLWGKSVMYDSALAVPLILAGPDVPAGAVVEQNASLVDAFPTILDSFGLEPHGDDADLPGASLWPAARGQDFPQRTIFAEYHAMGAPHAAYALCDGRYKYIHYLGHPPQLFDLAADPEERHDLAPLPASPLEPSSPSPRERPLRNPSSFPRTRESRPHPTWNRAGFSADILSLTGLCKRLREGEGWGEGSPASSSKSTEHTLPAPEPPAVVVQRMQTELRRLVDPAAVDAAAKADQRACLQANGGEAAVRAAGPQINFTRAPEQFR